MSGSPLHKDFKDVVVNHLPEIFKHILLLWRNEPSHSSWAMEKMMELFKRCIAQEEEILNSIDFTHFLNGFFEMENLIDYPDFVMNNVSIMAAEVFLALPDQSFSFEDVAFKVIRSPLQFWMVNKGHRVDVTFTLYGKFIQQNVKIHLLEQVNFDIDQAFAHALTSSYNYTRKSAAGYFVDLVKLAYQPPSEELLSTAATLRLQLSISQMIDSFHVTMMGMLDDSSDKYSHLSLASIVANYCQLMSQCAQTCEKWCQNFASTSLFESVTELVLAISGSVITDTTDLCRDIIILLLKLISYSNDSVKAHKLHTLRSCLHHLCMMNNYITSCDIVHGAGQILFDRKCETDKSLFLELSILPLLVMLGVKPLKVLDFCPAFVERMQIFIESEQKTKPSGLIKESISNLILISESIPHLKEVNVDTYLPLISYLSLSTLQCPANIQTLMAGNKVCSNVVVSFIACLCMSYNKAKKDDLRKIFQNIQVYTRALLNSHGNSFWQLDSVLDFYTTAINCLCKQAKEEVLVEIMNDILKCLHLKMVAIESSVREMAVKVTGDLYLTSKTFTIQCPEMSRSVQSMWKCLEDKADGVACKVLDVLWEIVKADNIEDFLEVTNCAKENVILTLQQILLEQKRDDLKPVAYNLLTKFSSKDTLVRYAQVCLQQSNNLLSTAVLEHMHSVFKNHVQDNTNLKKAADSVMTLLSQGWGDLLLHKVNSQDVCGCRLAVSTLESLLQFMSSPEVVVIVNTYLKDYCREVSSPQSKDYCKVKNTFLGVCEKLLNAQGFYKQQRSEEEISEEPVNKKARIEDDQTESHYNMSDDVLQFLSISMNEDAGEIIEMTNITAKADDEEIYLDSTKDLPPLELSCEPFLSQKCTYAMTSQSETNSDCTKLMLWLVFKEIFRQVNPTIMRNEAMRSTDEYVRNSLMVVNDLEVAMEKTFKTRCLELEQELTEFVMKRISLLQVEVFKGNVTLEHLLQEMIQTLRYLHLLITDHTAIVTAILKQRKIYIKAPDVRGDAFVLIKFSDIMRSQAEHKTGSVSKFPSLQSILDDYLNINTASEFSDIGGVLHAVPLSTAVPTADQATTNSTLISNINSELANICKNLNSTKLAQALQGLNCKQLRDLSVALSAGGSLSKETLKEGLEKLMLLNRRYNFKPLIKYILGFVKIMFAAVLDQDDKSKEDTSTSISTCFKLLTSWTTLDEYDNEDDPCTLDCG